MLHNFDISLLNERNQSHRADAFYSQHLKAQNIVRFDKDTSEDMHMQKRDIDVSIVIDGKTYLVSEKFRNKDFGDIYIELFSKYPHSKGWLEQNYAQALLYFTPSKVYWIGYQTLHWFAHNLLFAAINRQVIDEFAADNKLISSCSIKINGQTLAIKLIKAPNACDGNSWTTIGLSIEPKFLIQFGVNVKVFDL